MSTQSFFVFLQILAQKLQKIIKYTNNIKINLCIIIKIIDRKNEGKTKNTDKKYMLNFKRG